MRTGFRCMYFVMIATVACGSLLPASQVRQVFVIADWLVHFGAYAICGLLAGIGFERRGNPQQGAVGTDYCRRIDRGHPTVRRPPFRLARLSSQCVRSTHRGHRSPILQFRTFVECLCERRGRVRVTGDRNHALFIENVATRIMMGTTSVRHHQ